MKKKILVVAGARPNFIKIAPLLQELKIYNSEFEPILVHTGQHYDFQMSQIFFQELDIPSPDINLEVGSGSQALQTAKIMEAFEPVVMAHRPWLVIVVGDVNSTLACALVAAKLNVLIAHVEAGLRSFDRSMPEEINRVVTDCLSDYLFVSEESGVRNLEHEGLGDDKIFFVGNIMIDTLMTNMPAIDRSGILTNLGLRKQAYSLVTLHRPGNVDSKQAMEQIANILETIASRIPVIYPIHPRTRNLLKDHNLEERFESVEGLKMIEPLGYLEFLKLVKESLFVLTDSGGIQEETTVLKIPCLTMRENTERPVTIAQGTNCLMGLDQTKILRRCNEILSREPKMSTIPKYWDGKTAQRIVQILRTADSENHPSFQEIFQNISPP